MWIWSKTIQTSLLFRYWFKQEAPMMRCCLTDWCLGDESMREQTEWTPRQSYGTRLSQISIALKRIRYARHSHQDPPIQLSIRFPFWRSQSARAPPSPHSFIRGAPPTRSDPLIVLNQARVSLKACEQGFAGKNTTGNELKPEFKGCAVAI